MKPDPDSAGVILINRGGLIARQAFRLAVYGEHIVAQPIQSAIHAHPEISLSVLVDAAHPIPLGGIRQWITHEATIFQPRQSAIRSGPQVAVAILPYRPNEIVGQTVFGLIEPQLALEA